MAIEHTGGFCESCNADRKVERKAPNHILHLLITIVLGFIISIFGALIWIIVWILVSIRFGGWMCSTCGSKKIKFDNILNSSTISNKKLIFYIVAAIALVFVLNLAKEKTGYKEIEKEVDISTKYEILTNNLTKDECIDISIDYIMSKLQTSANIKVLNETFFAKDNKSGTINIQYEQDEKNYSFTGKCLKSDKVIVEELEHIQTN